MLLSERLSTLYSLVNSASLCFWFIWVALMISQKIRCCLSSKVPLLLPTFPPIVFQILKNSPASLPWSSLVTFVNVYCTFCNKRPCGQVCFSSTFLIQKIYLFIFLLIYLSLASLFCKHWRIHNAQWIKSCIPRE